MPNIVYGAYTSYLNETFFVEERKAYDLDDPISGHVVAAVMKRHPDAFRATPDPAPAPPPVEQATAAPGETRRTGPKHRG
jgi:hypothetical protein